MHLNPYCYIIVAIVLRKISRLLAASLEQVQST